MSYIEEIKKLSKLKDDGILSEEEFQKKKEEILSQKDVKTKTEESNDDDINVNETSSKSDKVDTEEKILWYTYLLPMGFLIIIWKFLFVFASSFLNDCCFDGPTGFVSNWESAGTEFYRTDTWYEKILYFWTIPIVFYSAIGCVILSFYLIFRESEEGSQADNIKKRFLKFFNEIKQKVKSDN